MIKTTTLKTIYSLEDTGTHRAMTVEVSTDKIRLLNYYGKQEFVFSTSNTKETRARWRNVAKLITKACDLV
jgi:hypothetical protein